jgi:alpha-glutamyl/putrescinyl thymine pyrophosphorylase clade 1
LEDTSSPGTLPGSSETPVIDPISEFWKFVAERHAIWQRRQEGLAAPWTTDAVLSEMHFCNVFRELDKGCRWYKKRIVPATTDFPDLLWRTIVFRLVNNWETFHSLGGIHARVEWRDMIAQMRHRGIVLNSLAHLTLARPAHLTTRLDRLEFILDLLTREFSVLVSMIAHAESLQEVSEALQSEYGIGPFIALQIYRDLIMVGQLPFTDDDWVDFGPGAERGLRRIVPDLAARDMRAYTVMIREGQWGAFKRLRLPPVQLNGHDVSLGDVEHSLCEWSRYCNLSDSTGSKKRRYVPSPAI